jgi:hypothetical protein
MTRTRVLFTVGEGRRASFSLCRATLYAQPAFGMRVQHALALFAWCLFASSCASTDPLFKEVEARVGSAAIACGVVLPGDDSSQADACAVFAFQRGLPFWVGYGSCTTDGAFESLYIVSTGENRLRAIRYEISRARATSRFGAIRSVVDRECVPETFQVAPGHFRIGCPGERRAPT